MKSPILAILLLLTAHNPASGNAHAASPVVDMRGTVQISFEQAEFVYQGQTYYLNDEHGVLSDWIAQQRAASKAFFIRQNICLNGKADNHNHGFGALERYERAVVVRKMC